MSNNLLPSNWNSYSLAEIARIAPVEPLSWSLCAQYGVQVSIKREDLLDEALGGNKFYKLYGHLNRLKALGHTKALTFGGAFSNHIHAFSAAGRALGIQTVGVIRGERPKSMSPTLIDATRCGMHIKFISRADYRKKSSGEFLSLLENEFGDFYCIPEGGGDQLGAEGCAVWATEAMAMCPLTPSHIALACGTGATLAGVYSAVSSQSVHGFLALKGSDLELDRFASNVLAMATGLNPNNEAVNLERPSFSLETNYHCGGYAKYPEYLKQFVGSFIKETGVPLDRVYTAKVFWGLKCMLEQGLISSGSHILVLHTGGLQGNR